MKKLCECGCGQETSIAKRTNTRFGYIKGKPIRFIFNHHPKLPRPGHIFLKDQGRWYVNHRGNLHRTLWSRIVYSNFYLNGKEIPPGMEVHHKDGNPENDIPENLELISKKIHAQLHRGKITRIERTKEFLEFPSASQAGYFLGITPAAMCWAIKNKEEIDGWKISHGTNKEIPSGMFLHFKDEESKYISLDDLDRNKREWSKSKKITFIKKDGKILEFSSCSKAAKYLDVSSMSISSAARKKTKVKGWEVCYKQ